MIAVIKNFGTAWYFFTLEIVFMPGKQAKIYIVSFKGLSLLTDSL